MTEDIQNRASRLINTPNRTVITDPGGGSPFSDPLMFLLMLPFLPFYLLMQAFNSGGGSRRRTAITEIIRTGEGWQIFEYER